MDYAQSNTEPILAIATTRGLPSTISDSFFSAINHNGACIKGSLESHLAALNHFNNSNPYLAHMGIPFKQWINTEATVCNPDGGLAFKGKIFLTSRLDSDRQYDCDLQPMGTHGDAVVALLERSMNLRVNKFACTIVVDVNAGNTSEVARAVGNRMRSQRWCVYSDTTSSFLHGLYNPDPNLQNCGTLDTALEGQYLYWWHELVHCTLGRNSYVFPGGGEAVCNDYVKYYNPHPAGLFLSHESYNGIGLRNPDYPFPSDVLPGGSTHGSVLHWIARGGSFTFGGVNGWGPVIGQYLITNLYEHGLTWGEAAGSEMSFRSFGCPVGDPLARVIVCDPDLNADGVIDQLDIDQFAVYLLQQAPEGDINHDDLVNTDDYWFIYETLGRNAYALPLPPQPPAPWPPPVVPTANTCGDITGNGIVDQDDLDLFDERIGLCGNLYSGMFDVNHDLAVSMLDRDIINSSASWPHCLVDANLDTCVNDQDSIDLQAFLGTYGPIEFPDVNWISSYDVNCDGWIDSADYNDIRSAVKHEWQCPNCTPP